MWRVNSIYYLPCTQPPTLLSAHALLKKKRIWDKICFYVFVGLNIFIVELLFYYYSRIILYINFAELCNEYTNLIAWYRSRRTSRIVIYCINLSILSFEIHLSNHKSQLNRIYVKLWLDVINCNTIIVIIKR